jgi:hypothetical protein
MYAILTPTLNARHQMPALRMGVGFSRIDCGYQSSKWPSGRVLDCISGEMPT